MKRNDYFITIVCIALVCITVINLAGCALEVQTKDLMEGVKRNQIDVPYEPHTQNQHITDFSVRLFQASVEGSANTLISPLSILCALAMTANGAGGETLEEMESVLGMTTEELNLYLCHYITSLPSEEKHKLGIANSVWLAEDVRLTVNRDFLQTNADYYGADIYEAPFNQETCKNINRWVRKKTDGMIPKIMDNLSQDEIMCLVNAIVFDAEWLSTYERDQVKEGVFIKENGSEEKADFMYGEEHAYFEDEMATGFMKTYKGGRYAFVAMLPKEGIVLSEYIKSLNGEKLHNLLSTPYHTTVNTSIPKFETEHVVELSGTLKAIGMSTAFDISKANFERLGASSAGNIYIGHIFHKTFISVGEKGTKAGAATAIIAADGAAIEIEDPKEVYLNRPFVYMLIDCENSIPIFMGTMMDPKS